MFRFAQHDSALRNKFYEGEKVKLLHRYIGSESGIPFNPCNVVTLLTPLLNRI